MLMQEAFLEREKQDGYAFYKPEDFPRGSCGITCLISGYLLYLYAVKRGVHQ